MNEPTFCDCGATIAENKTDCGRCRRWREQRDRANAIIADAMIVIARAAVLERETGDSRKIEMARAAVIEKLKDISNP